MPDLVYLYGFVPAGTPDPSSLSGIAGRKIELTAAGEVEAVMSRVPADDFGADAIEARLQDLSWVAEQGVAHEHVVAWFVDHAQILPVPLFTLYSSTAALESAARERGAFLASELRRLHGLREWDLKVSYEQARLEENAEAVSASLATLEQEIASANPGRRYLLQKKRADQLKTELRKAAQALALEVLQLAQPLTREVLALPLPKSGDELPVVLHAALLVPVEREAALIETLESKTAELNRIGMNVAFSGPWAPYRFTSGDESR